MKDKLQEAMLYIAQQSENDSAFGSVKLNKILFLIDFYSYGLQGKTVTGSGYIHLPQGPCPKNRPSAQDALITNGRAAIQERLYFGKGQKRLIALVPPDMSVFSELERSLIDDAIAEMKHLNATQASDWTHSLIPWIVTGDKEDMPPYTAFVMKKKTVGREGILWAEKRLKEIREDGLS